MVALGLGLWAVVGLVALHVNAFRTSPRLLGMLLFADFLVASVLGTGSVDPAKWASLTFEDGAVEWATVFFLLVAGGLFSRQAIGASKKLGWLPRFGAAGLAAFSFFVAGEEVSWGQRLVGFLPPKMFLEKNAQQELNLHNFFNQVPVVGNLNLTIADFMIAFSVVLGGLGPLLFRRQTQGLGAALRRTFPSPAVGSVLVLSAAMLVWMPLVHADELAEAILAFGLVLVAVVPLWEVADGEASAKPRMSLALKGAAMVGVPVGLALVTTSAVDWIVVGDSRAAVALATEEAQMLASDLVSSRATLERNSFDDRVFNAVRRGFVTPTTA